MRLSAPIASIAAAALVAAGLGAPRRAQARCAAQARAEPAADPSPADRAEAQRRREDAQDQFAAGHYDAAIEGFRGASELSPDPTDLFNIGRIYEETGDLESALSYYEDFSRQPRLTLEERGAAAERIEVLRVLVEADQADAEPAPPPPTSGSAAALEPRSVEPAASDRPPSDEGRVMVATGGALVGFGAAAAIAGGVGFGVRAQRDSQAVSMLQQGSNPDRLSLSNAEDLHARGRNAEVLQITFLAAGAAIAAAGTGVLVAGLLRRRRAKLEALAPTVSPGHFALHAAWRF